MLPEYGARVRVSRDINVNTPFFPSSHIGYEVSTLYSGTNKQLITGPKGNSEFCFPETLNIEVEGEQNSLFPEGPVIKCFVIPSN